MSANSLRSGLVVISKEPSRARRARSGIEELLRQIMTERGPAVTSPVILRDRFEDALRSLVSVPVRLCDAPRGGLSPDDSALAERMRVAVPVPPGRPPVALELAPQDGARLGEREVRFLELAALVAGLILVGGSESATRQGLPPVGETKLVGSSAAMGDVRRRIDQVANADIAVLIEGETGTGKELIARRLHERSARRRGPFVAVNCAALVETLVEVELFGIEDRTATGVRGRHGKFEHADGGTLFLDEVGDLSPAAQAKLLRAVQDTTVERVGGRHAQRVDTRIITATNRRLSELVTTGTFRADLFYRLNGVEIQVPPLRARLTDVVELAQCFLRQRCGGCFHLSNAALEAMQAYHWPGNVRELEQAIVRAAALATSNEIGVDELPPCVTRLYTEVLRPSVDAGDSMRAWGSRYAKVVLERCGNNKRKTCERLAISYHTLQPPVPIIGETTSLLRLR